MKKFRVGLHYSETGHTIVEANNTFQAEAKVEKELADNGIDNLEIKQTNREYGVTDVTSLEIDLFKKK